MKNEYLENVMTFSEACKRWGLGESTLRKAAKSGRFKKDEIKKSGKCWLITRSAIERLYGKEKKEN